MIRMGFEYYREVRLLNGNHNARICCIGANGDWNFYAAQLRNLERDLRDVRMREILVKKSIIQTRSEMKACRMQLEGVSRQDSGRRSPLALLNCQRKAHVETRSALENSLAIATLNISSQENELELIKQEKSAATALQTALLKNAFTGCKRHMCQSADTTFE